MEHMIGRIDPDEYDDYEERGLGGGGGGGGGKGKDKKQGDLTLQARRTADVEGAKRKRKEKRVKHPEVTEDLNTDMEVTLFRVVDMDKENVGVPSLQEYVQWVYRRLNDEVEVDVESECDLEFEKASGPGGQNVNKVATAVRSEHRFTGLRVLERQERSQEKNRDNAKRRMTDMVADHLEKWESYVVGQNGEMRRIMVTKVREVLKGNISEDKKESFDSFCRMMGRYPADHVFVD